MKAKVLTDRGRPVQVIEVSQDDGAAMCVVSFRVSDNSSLIHWPGMIGGSQATTHQMREAARQALWERDAHMLTDMTARIRSVLVGRYGIGQTITPTVLSPGGRKISFEFDRRTLESGTERYELVLRRKRV